MAVVTNKSSRYYLKRLLDADEKSPHDDIFKAVKNSLTRLRSWHKRGLLDKGQYQDIKLQYAKKVLAHEDFIARYTEGDCHMLAVVLHNRLGWPISVCHDEGKDYSDAEIAELAHHSFVTAPDGRVLDIYGYRSLKRVLREFACHQTTEIDVDNLHYEDWSWDALESGVRKASKSKAQFTANLLCLIHSLDA